MQRLTLETLVAEDVFWLRKALKKDYHELTETDILDRLEKEFDLWRLDSGIVVTSIISHLHGRELFLSHIAGERVLEHIPEINKVLEEYGIKRSCRWYAAFLVRKGLFSFGANAGEEVGRLYKKDLRKD